MAETTHCKYGTIAQKSHIRMSTPQTLKIIDKDFHNNKQKWKIAEALWIKDLRLTWNTKEKSIQLKLFN